MDDPLVHFVSTVIIYTEVIGTSLGNIMNVDYCLPKLKFDTVSQNFWLDQNTLHYWRGLLEYVNKPD